MDNPTVSVIIPVYKTERFLDECLNSVIGQDYPALEIILVDDGSPDSCPEMCDRYAETYGSVKVIHKDNGGPGPARNTGLESAAGKYITFVDSDDCLDGPSAIRLMVEQAEKKNADIVVGLYRRFCGGQAGAARHGRIPDGGYTETVDFRFKGFTIYYPVYNLTTPWCKLYRLSFLDRSGLMFKDYPFAEDKVFNMMCCACKPVYAFVDESVYLYRDNSDSLMYRYWDDFIPVWTAAAYDLEHFLSGRGVMEEYGDLVAFHICLGLVFLSDQELGYKGLRHTVGSLSAYGRDPLVRRRAGELARGRHIDRIEPRIWKAMVWGASLLCSLRANVLLALGMWVLKKIQLGERFLGAK